MRGSGCWLSDFIFRWGDSLVFPAKMLTMKDYKAALCSLATLLTSLLTLYPLPSLPVSPLDHQHDVFATTPER